MPTYFARSDMASLIQSDRIAFLYWHNTDSSTSLSSSGIGVDSLEEVIRAVLLDVKAVAPEGKRPALTIEVNKLFKLVEIAAEFAAGTGATEEGGDVPDFGSTQEVVGTRVD